MKTLEYYFVRKGVFDHVIFNKYTIDENGVIRNKTGKALAYTKRGKYKQCSVIDDSENKRGIQIGRAIASTFIGPPSSIKHTADHIDRTPANDVIGNIRWLCKKGQRNNQERPDEYKSAFIVVKDGLDKTIKDWVEYLNGITNHMGRDYTKSIIERYAQKKKHGFSYKEYPDLTGEVWKDIYGSEDAKGGHWEISNMNRVKRITKHAENVLYGERLGMTNDGYPRININKKNWYCHILSFMTFFPLEYANRKPDEIVLHEDDDKTDFRPHKLRIGTKSENAIDARNNEKHNNTATTRMKCASYTDGILEKAHESQTDAARYLKSLGYAKASYRGVGRALVGAQRTAYDRTWRLI